MLILYIFCYILKTILRGMFQIVEGKVLSLIKKTVKMCLKRQRIIAIKLFAMERILLMSSKIRRKNIFHKKGKIKKHEGPCKFYHNMYVNCLRMEFVSLFECFFSRKSKIL